MPKRGSKPKPKPKPRPQGRPGPKLVERVQTGLRLEKRTVKVLKALAEYLDMSTGELVEGIVLHAFEGKPALEAETLEVVEQLRQVYGLELTAKDSHNLAS